jgi:hypothetical protein
MAMYPCVDCGAQLATAAGLTLHESTAHSAAAVRYATPGPDVRTLMTAPDRPRRAPRLTARQRSIRIGAVVIVLVLAAGVVAATRVSSPDRSVEPAGAASPAAPAPAKDLVATAREQYVELAAEWNAEVARLGAKSQKATSSKDTEKLYAGFADALNEFDEGLREIEFPASVKPHADAVLADDAQLVSAYEALADDLNRRDDVTTALDRVRDKRAADIQRLRAALGLPPST